MTPYQKRVQKEKDMRKFFTQTCNNGALNIFLKKYGLRLTTDGHTLYTIFTYGVNETYKNYLDNIVMPALEKELNIKDVKSHKKPTTLSHNLLQWYKAEIINNNTNEGE